jgi:hypothetical protein
MISPLRLQAVVQDPQTLESTRRQVYVCDRDAAPQAQELRKHVGHGSGVFIAAPTLMRNEMRIQLLHRGRRERFPQAGEKEAVQVEVALPPPDVGHDEDGQPGGIGAQTQVGFGPAERSRQPLLESLQLGSQIGTLRGQHRYGIFGWRGRHVGSALQYSSAHPVDADMKRHETKHVWQRWDGCPRSQGRGSKGLSRLGQVELKVSFVAGELHMDLMFGIRPQGQIPLAGRYEGINHVKRPHESTARLAREEAELWVFVIQPEGCGETAGDGMQHEGARVPLRKDAMFDGNDQRLQAGDGGFFELG